MSKIFLESKKLYVSYSNKYIYEVYAYDAYDNYMALHYDLRLIAGKNESKCYVNANNFDESLQDEVVVQYFVTESLHHALIENGYIIITRDVVDDILKRID